MKEFRFNVTVIPKSSRSEILIEPDNSIKIYLNSPPADGKANEELTKLFSKRLKVAKSKIKIISGLKSRKKSILIEGLKREEIVLLLRKKLN